MSFDKSIKILPNTDYQKIRSIDDPLLSPCDLLVIYTFNLSSDLLMQYIEGFESRMICQNNIHIPALFVCPHGPDRVPTDFERLLRSNWYFDIIDTSQLSSLTWRIVNLLKIHDHLHELQRYETEMRNLQTRVSEIESEIQKLPKGES